MAPTGERADGLKCDSCRANPSISRGSTLCRVAAAETSGQKARGYASAQKSSGNPVAGRWRYSPKNELINVDAVEKSPAASDARAASNATASSRLNDDC